MQRLISILFLALSVCIPLFAANEADSVVLGEVTIVARPATHEVITPQTLSGNDLQRLSAHSVADAMRYFSGVQIK
ncbi:MAG: TonB-dependent receptor, partial [Paludibacteraceae bacterium]|nr:TonB-dependent receptor [Paludibacteraceae bacterium]